MEFYNLKTRTKVEIPESDLTKHKTVRPTKTGEQTRYTVKATYEGTKLTKFVKKEEYDSLKNVKEGESEAKAAAPAEKKAPAKKAAAPAKKAVAPKKK